MRIHIATDHAGLETERTSLDMVRSMSVPFSRDDERRDVQASRWALKRDELLRTLDAVTLGFDS